MKLTCLISGFHRKVDEVCAVLGYYAVSSGNFLLRFWDNLSFGFLTPEEGTNSMAENTFKKLPLLAA
jgi:hypothetical protein